MLGRKKKEEVPGRVSRNLSGRTQPVFSYYSNRAPSQEPKRDTARISVDQTGKKRTRKTAWWIVYFPSLLSLVVVIGSVLYLTTLSTKPRVDIVTADKRLVAVQPVEVYQDAAERLMKSSIFNSSKILIETDKLAQNLKQEFPELGEVVVTVPLTGRRPTIQVQPAVPALVLSSQKGSFVIDTTGRPVLTADKLLSSIRDKLPVVTDESNTAVSLGKQIFATDFVTFVDQTEEYLRANSVEVESYTLPTLSNQLHARVKGENYFIKFNTEVDARQQVGTYIALRDKLRADNVVPAEYVDVRVEERAYFK